MTDEQPFAGRVALVTGASGGIGRAIAEALAAEGAAVGLHYSSSPDPAHRLAERIAARGGRSAVFGADLRDRDAAAALVDRVTAQLGPIELLVNNAGVGRRLTWEQTTIEDFDESYAVNLRAPFLLTQRALPAMVAARLRPGAVHVVGGGADGRRRRTALCICEVRTAWADAFPRRARWRARG